MIRVNVASHLLLVFSVAPTFRHFSYEENVGMFPADFLNPTRHKTVRNSGSVAFQNYTLNNYVVNIHNQFNLCFNVAVKLDALLEFTVKLTVLSLNSLGIVYNKLYVHF